MCPKSEISVTICMHPLPELPYRSLALSLLHRYCTLRSQFRQLCFAIGVCYPLLLEVKNLRAVSTHPVAKIHHGRAAQHDSNLVLTYPACGTVLLVLCILRWAVLQCCIAFLNRIQDIVLVQAFEVCVPSIPTRFPLIALHWCVCAI